MDGRDLPTRSRGFGKASKPGHDPRVEPEGRLVEDKRAGALARVEALAHHWGMVGPRQANLFGDDGQADLFGEAEVPAYRPPDLDKVRARLHKILAETRAAKALPWDRASLFRAIFPQMTLWLPEDEGAQLRLEFEQEMERLKAA